MQTQEEKDRLEVLKAIKESEVREDPEEYGLNAEGRVTDASIRSVVTRDKEVKKQTQKYLKALKNEKVLAKVERSFEHRKRALTDLVHLNVQLNFADVKTPRTKDIQNHYTRKNLRSSLKKSKITRR